MEKFKINPIKIKFIKLSCNTEISKARLFEGDHNSSYGFKSYVSEIEFLGGEKYYHPEIEIEKYYTSLSSWRPHYFHMLVDNYEKGKHIPYFIEEYVLQSVISLENVLKTDSSLRKFCMLMTYPDKKEYSKLKLKYSI